MSLLQMFPVCRPWRTWAAQELRFKFPGLTSPRAGRIASRSMIGHKPGSGSAESTAWVVRAAGPAPGLSQTSHRPPRPRNQRSDQTRRRRSPCVT